MQALFSSFYVNLNILVENLKTPENGGFKPFLGLFSCVPFLQIGEIPIFPLYIVACFWKFCHLLPFWPQTFVQVRKKTAPLFFGGCWTCPTFLIPIFWGRVFFAFSRPLGREGSLSWCKAFPFTACPSAVQEKPWENSPKAFARQLPHKTPPSSPTASVDRQRPCSSQ